MSWMNQKAKELLLALGPSRGLTYIFGKWVCKKLVEAKYPDLRKSTKDEYMDGFNNGVDEGRRQAFQEVYDFIKETNQ